jgi:quinol monooxygenase YgiN
LLTSLGLPAGQAEKSVTTDATGIVDSAIPTSVYAVLKIKEGADMDALTAALKEYSAASRASAGKVNAAYSIADGEVQFHEIFSGPGAMDAHIGNCFPAYAKMLPHADMHELIAACDPAELDFWKTSASAWDASKFIVAPSI